MAATPTQGLSVELLLGSSLLPSDGVLWPHQAELLVPPRGRRGKSGHHSPWGHAPLGRSQGTVVVPGERWCPTSALNTPGACPSPGDLAKPLNGPLFPDQKLL